MSSESNPPPNAEDNSGQHAYNIVSDTVTGANLRLWDNLIQIGSILICTPLGAGIGALIPQRDWILGAVAGGFIGLLAGLFGSGIFLMVYRAVRHLGGKHD